MALRGTLPRVQLRSRLAWKSHGMNVRFQNREPLEGIEILPNGGDSSWQSWQRASLMARLCFLHHLANQGGDVSPPRASDRRAISIWGDEAHPEVVKGLRIEIPNGLRAIGLDGESTANGVHIQVSSLSGMHPVVGGKFLFANRGVRKDEKRDAGQFKDL